MHKGRKLLKTAALCIVFICGSGTASPATARDLPPASTLPPSHTVYTIVLRVLSVCSARRLSHFFLARSLIAYLVPLSFLYSSLRAAFEFVGKHTLNVLGP